jgi:peroxiredoxin
MALQVGTPAPDFTLRTQGPEGLADWTLSDHLGETVVLLFFPGAFTGVCTEEFCDPSGGLQALQGAGATVVGISCDTVFAQQAWATKEGITTTLLADYDKKVTEAYDVIFPNLAGMGRSSERAVFVINGEGVITYVQVTENPGVLPDFVQVLANLG